ncbi:MAG: TonB-dependent receptor [Porphyromonadaceae bacterium]|nr:TonB-dependent receptor [Porphyromonadaceae bacterium]
MKKIFFTLTFILFAILSVASQTNNPAQNITIKGIVTDSTTNESIPFATISAYLAETPEKSIKKMAADVNGKFEMPVTASDTLLLTFESVGMNTKTIYVTDFSSKTIDLGKILISPNDKILTEVVVTAAKPLVKVDLDKITYDTKSDPESETANAFEMLKKVPLITVDSEEKIQLKGKSDYKIFINGKPSNLTSGNPTEILKTLPASTIKHIEVITEPGVKYESEGLSGIINIVTEKAVVGYNASVNASVDQFGGVNGGVSLTTKIGKLGISTRLNYGNRPRPESFSTGERFNKITEETLFQDGSYKSRNQNQYGTIELNYELDTLNLISLSGSGWGGGYSSKGLTTSFQKDINGIENQRFRQFYDMQGSYGGYDANLNYQRSFKKPDKLFTVSYRLSYSPNGSETNNNIIGDLNYFSENRHIKSNSSGSEHTFQVDYTEPFNKKHVMELGVKYILRYNGSETDYRQLDTLDNQWKVLEGMNLNDMLQKQGILGAYGSYTFRLNKFSARAGTRLEHTNTTIDFKNNPSNNFEVPSFTNLVPNVRLSYKLQDAMTVQLGYNQRLSRPGIWYLNPFFNNSDPTNVSQGNPNLKTEISNSFSLSYSYFTPKFNLNVSLNTGFTNNSIERTTELRQYEDGKTYQYSTYQNIGKSNYNSMYTYGRWQITQKLSVNLNASMSYNIYDTGIPEIGRREGFQYQFYSGANYTLPWDLYLSANGGYSSPWIALQGQYSPWYYYGASLTKQLLNNKMNISLRASQMFEKYRVSTNFTETPTFRSENTNHYPFRNISLSVSYRFGEMKEQIQRTRRGISNDDVKSEGGEGGASGGGGEN